MKSIECCGFSEPCTLPNIKKKVPAKPGVFLLWIKKKDKWKFFYSAAAKNLKSELSRCFTEQGPKAVSEKLKTEYCGFEILKIKDQTKAQDLAKYFKKTFKKVSLPVFVKK
jgi:excinuclease UvrABC nuclease subunit